MAVYHCPLQAEMRENNLKLVMSRVSKQLSSTAVWGITWKGKLSMAISMINIESARNNERKSQNQLQKRKIVTILT